ncbi:hypothetical protein MAA8898_01284 [Maliponia aquimaris]|uniref:Uncharacterized protein n=1 Tax=Maliponia aquimaris TaxID=1673631 RepID=A0A238K5Y9_9RHOB|nr:hypothetical protein MAA8898_01284 [Maliponia aquimaris]
MFPVVTALLVVFSLALIAKVLHARRKSDE